MPDFDTFERLFKSVMSADLSSDEGALQISALPESNKVAVVKSRTPSELKGFLERSRTSLLSFFPGNPTFTSNDDNQDGKDLFEMSSKTHVELKSGAAMTDANAGLGSISWAIGDTQGKLSAIMSNAVKERRLLVQQNSLSTQIEASKKKEMDSLLDLFNSLLKLGPAPATLDHFVRCVSIGLTKGPEIQSAFNSTRSVSAPLLLQADWQRGLKLYSKPFQDDETIEIIKIERTTRAQVILMGSKSGREATLYPHHRNSWTSPRGKKYGADNWVSTGSFQVWIG
jgi:hypothetical protein